MLKGGIGNQFFQIAFGLKLSRMRGWELLFDDSFFSSDPYGHSSVLHAFPELAKKHLVDTFDASKSASVQEDAAFDVVQLFNKNVPISDNISFIYFDGYWQDRKYFDIEDIIYLKNELSNYYNKSTASITGITNTNNLTSIHFRRKDYRHHGLCGDAYYAFSLRYFLEKYKSLNLLVFSDEPNATNFLLNSWDLKYTVINTGYDLSDLHIMSLCNNHIIANSTFSWWGSVLSGSDNVIYPDEWSKIHVPSKSLFSENWIPILNSMEEPSPKMISIKFN